MQLDLLYKGLPSAKADTRKFRVQIHSNAISFIQHEGCGSEGGGGRERVTLYTSSLPSTLRPPRTSSHLPSVTFPPSAKEDGKKKIKGKKGKGCGRAGASPEQPGDGDAPNPGTHLGSPQGHRGQLRRAEGPRAPGSGLSLPSPTLPGQKPRSREILLGWPGV